MTASVAAPSIPGLLREGVARLEAVGLPTARQDAEWLLATVLGSERFDLYLEPGRAIDGVAAERYRELVERRSGHEPLQHLLGFEDFRGLRLSVTPDVLIPRPETEGLVGWAIEILARRPVPVVADVGTGSGAIACALAAELPRATIVAVDASRAALAVAARNAEALGLSARVRLVAGDLLDPLRRSPRLDMIVANLPYLPSAVLPTLPREVSGFEPRLALDGGPDGLEVIRRLVRAAPSMLVPGGVLLMEIGEEQAGPLASLMAAEGLSDIAARRDLHGVERYIAGRLPGGDPADALARRGTC